MSTLCQYFSDIILLNSDNTLYKINAKIIFILDIRIYIKPECITRFLMPKAQGHHHLSSQDSIINNISTTSTLVLFQNCSFWTLKVKNNTWNQWYQKKGGWNKGFSSFRGSKLKETGLKPIDQDSQHHTHSKKSWGVVRVGDRLNMDLIGRNTS